MKSKTIKYSSIKLAGLAAAGLLFLAASQANATKLCLPGSWHRRRALVNGACHQ